MCDVILQGDWMIVANGSLLILRPTLGTSFPFLPEKGVDDQVDLFLGKHPAKIRHRSDTNSLGNIAMNFLTTRPILPLVVHQVARASPPPMVTVTKGTMTREGNPAGVGLVRHRGVLVFGCPAGGEKPKGGTKQGQCPKKQGG